MCLEKFSFLVTGIFQCFASNHRVAYFRIRFRQLVFQSNSDLFRFFNRCLVVFHFKIHHKLVSVVFPVCDVSELALLFISESNVCARDKNYRLLKKSYDLPLDLLQYRREFSAEYLYS